MLAAGLSARLPIKRYLPTSHYQNPSAYTDAKQRRTNPIPLSIVDPIASKSSSRDVARWRQLVRGDTDGDKRRGLAEKEWLET